MYWEYSCKKCVLYWEYFLAKTPIPLSVFASCNFAISNMNLVLVKVNEMYALKICQLNWRRHQTKKCSDLIAANCKYERRVLEWGLASHNPSCMRGLIPHDVLNIETKYKFPGKIGMLRREGRHNSKAVGFRFCIVISLFFYLA